jgi:hypothetical protein
LIGWKTANRTGWSSGKVVELYLGDAGFESRSCHQLTWIKYFVAFLVLQRKFRILQDGFLPDTFQFIDRTVWRYVVQMLRLSTNSQIDSE